MKKRTLEAQLAEVDTKLEAARKETKRVRAETKDAIKAAVKAEEEAEKVQDVAYKALVEARKEALSSAGWDGDRGEKRLAKLAGFTPEDIEAEAHKDLLAQARSAVSRYLFSISDEVKKAEEQYRIAKEGRYDAATKLGEVGDPERRAVREEYSLEHQRQEIFKRIAKRDYTKGKKKGGPRKKGRDMLRSIIDADPKLSPTVIEKLGLPKK